MAQAPPQLQPRRRPLLFILPLALFVLVGGFLALGLAAESGAPVVVLTTSGTAVANLHPAVLEAAHSGVPLLVVSADRPHELRGIGANQTTRQVGIFGDVLPATWDVPAPEGAAGEEQAADALAAELLDGICGPRHLNLALREPLSSELTRSSSYPLWASVARISVSSPMLDASVSTRRCSITNSLAAGPKSAFKRDSHPSNSLRARVNLPQRASVSFRPRWRS